MIRWLHPEQDIDGYYNGVLSSETGCFFMYNFKRSYPTSQATFSEFCVQEIGVNNIFEIFKFKTRVNVTRDLNIITIPLTTFNNAIGHVCKASVDKDKLQDEINFYKRLSHRYL